MIGQDPASGLDFQAVLEQVPAIVFIVGAGERVPWLYVNNWIEPILGYSVEEWLAEPNWARSVHPDDRDGVLERVRVAEAGRSHEPYHDEYRLLHKDGHSIWVRENSKLVEDANGAMYWYGVLQDISAQKASEAELERQSAAQAAVARLGEHALERMAIEQLRSEACTAAADVLEIPPALVARLLADPATIDAPGAIDPGTIDNPGTIDAPATIERHAVAHWPGSAGTREFGISFIQSLANVLADAIERQRIEDAIEHRALHDPLTALPNRTLLSDRLAQAVERLRRHPGALAALLFIDLDNFKQINDSAGHQAGDELLVNVAQRLREAVRPTDTVARLSGDEFVVLLDEIAGERGAITAAERIAAGFSRAFILEAGTHFVTASLGIAITDGSISSQALLENADTAMYRAKEGGRARYELFGERMRARAVARMRTEGELLHALERQQLRLVYEPVVALATETMFGAESLLRWDHPQRGTLPAAAFLPLAQECGAIEEIGRWAIRQALRDAGQWLELADGRPPLHLGINVTIKQLQSPSFARELEAQISASQIAPGAVQLEFSERALLGDAEAARATLEALHALGVGLCVDDLGAGALAIRNLTEVPLRSVKVDRTLVAGLCTGSSASRVARALIALCGALSLRMIGEGTETAAQVAELRRLGCIGAQGPLFSAPLSAGGIATLLSSGRRLVRTLEA